MAELAQIGITDENVKCLEKLKRSEYFDEMQDAARFAASLAINKKLYIGKDLINIGTKLNTRWNTSLVDPDYFFRNFIKHCELCPSDYGIGLRSLIILGLDYIYSKIKDSEDILIGEFFDD